MKILEETQGIQIFHRFNNMTNADGGNFTCMGENRMGTDSQVFSITFSSAGIIKFNVNRIKN